MGVERGVIRKIVLGSDPMHGLAFAVGQEVGEGRKYKITQILADEAVFYQFGAVEYIVYAKSTDTEEEVWKVFKEIPITVEYFLGRKD